MDVLGFEERGEGWGEGTTSRTHPNQSVPRSPPMQRHPLRRNVGWGKPAHPSDAQSRPINKIWIKRHRSPRCPSHTDAGPRAYHTHHPQVFTHHPAACRIHSTRHVIQRPKKSQHCQHTVSASADINVFRDQGEFRLSGVPIRVDDNDTPDMSEVARIAWVAPQTIRWPHPTKGQLNMVTLEHTARAHPCVPATPFHPYFTCAHTGRRRAT
jgi:hypothetical protein